MGIELKRTGEFMRSGIVIALSALTLAMVAPHSHAYSANTQNLIGPRTNLRTVLRRLEGRYSGELLSTDVISQSTLSYDLVLRIHDEDDVVYQFDFVATSQSGQMVREHEEFILGADEILYYLGKITGDKAVPVTIVKLTDDCFEYTIQSPQGLLSSRLFISPESFTADLAMPGINQQMILHR